jgi:homogentisate 1,2-dioxygenase
VGEFPLHIRLHHGVQEYLWGHHPFDVVGYDGFYYPWIFNIKDYMPKVGRCTCRRRRTSPSTARAT